MHRWILTVAALAVATPAWAQERPGHDHHHDEQAAAAAEDAGSLPARWRARLDRPDASMANVRFVEMNGGYHVTLGPSGIFYDPANRADGEYTARARFTQMSATRHPESYGLLIGGQNLDEPDQDYLYFLVRQDGRFMIRHRGGEEVHTIQDWTEHPGIVPLEGEGSASNTLAIEAGPQRARFLVNGQQVASFEDVPHLNTAGIVGLRINHNLDVHVEDFEIEPRSRGR